MWCERFGIIILFAFGRVMVYKGITSLESGNLLIAGVGDETPPGNLNCLEVKRFLGVTKAR